MELIPICFTTNSNKQLYNVVDKFRKFLNTLNTPFLITYFAEYQQNNHKHYHSQLFINKSHLNAIKAYCNKNKPEIYASELINFEYVVKEIFPNFLKFNSNLKNFSVMVDFFKQIFNANFKNFDIVKNLYKNIFAKMHKKLKFNLKKETKMLSNEDKDFIKSLIQQGFKDLKNEILNEWRREGDSKKPLFATFIKFNKMPSNIDSIRLYSTFYFTQENS